MKELAIEVSKSMSAMTTCVFNSLESAFLYKSKEAIYTISFTKQQKANSDIYWLTQFDLTVNECS